MNWAMPTRIESKIGTATAVAMLITISGLVVPNHASATPTPLKDPDYTTIATELSFQTNGINVPTSPDGPKCARTPLSVSYENNPDDDDDDDDVYIYY